MQCQWKCHKTALTFGAPGRGILGISLEAVFLLLQVIIPVMMLHPHSLRLEVATVQQQFQLLHASLLWVHSHR
jgi:hypothetical protein